MSETPSPGFRIIGLRQENFKKIKLVDITPPRHLVKITGKNEQGKSSLMEGVAAALDGGAEFLQSVPIQKGKEKSVLRVTLGNGEKIEAIVTKTIRQREDGTFSQTLVVENADGYRAPQPQTMIDGFFGPMTFNPLKFMGMKPDKQFDQIAASVPGVDFADIARKNASDYARRTEVNRDAKRARAAAESIQVPDSIDAETQPIDEAVLTQELAGAGQHNATIERRKERREQAQTQLDAGPTLLKVREDDTNAAIQADQDALDASVADWRAEIARLEQRITDAKAASEQRQAEIAVQGNIKHNEIQKSLEDLRATLEGAEPLPDPIDTAELTARITEARNTNAAIRLRDQRDARVTEAEDLELESTRLTQTMEARDKGKEDAIAKAKLPVPGLSLGVDAKGDGIVLLDGLPLAQASHARKLRVSALIAMSMNTKLRVMLIQEGAFLDEDNMEILSQMAIEHDYQIFVELVDGSGKVGFVLEDGAILGAEPPPAEPEAKARAPRKAKTTKAGEDLF